jgi:hypothetical protein
LLLGNIFLESDNMPWEIKQGTSQCSGYGVFKEGTDQLEGCHETREAAQRQMSALYASEPEASKSASPEFEKYRGELYAMLTEEEKAFHDALISIAQQYGPFDLGTSGIWVGYEPAAENEDSEIGVKCSNCSFFVPENNGCAILSYQVEPEGKCRLAAIPNGLVMPKMEREEEKEFVEQMTATMDKADSVRVGQMVSWNSSGGRATGRVTRVIRSGKVSVPGSSFSITGTAEDPAALIRIYRNGRPTDTIVGHKVSTLRIVGQKSVWGDMFKDWRKDG